MSDLSLEAKLGLLKQALSDIAGSRASIKAIGDFLYRSKEINRIKNVEKIKNEQEGLGTQKVYNPMFISSHNWS
jgi:hypothetical protein